MKWEAKKDDYVVKIQESFSSWAWELEKAFNTEQFPPPFFMCNLTLPFEKLVEVLFHLDAVVALKVQPGD